VRKKSNSRFRSPNCLALAAVAALVGCATTRPPAPGSPAAFDAAIAAAERGCQCQVGVAARHLESGRSYEHNGEADFESASVIKIAVLTEAMAEAADGKVDLSQRWELTDAEKADGSGVLLLLDPGLQPTWNDLVTLMIGPSDNTATDAWIARLGVESINARMASLGFPHIRLLGSIPALSRRGEEPSPWKDFHLGWITPHETAEWMSRVARGELLDADSSAKIFRYLDNDPSRQRIARRFPPSELWAGKTGSMSGVRNDSGILRTRKGRFVLVILTQNGRAVGWGPDHPSILAIADVAKTIVDGWSADLPDIVEKPE
jgi:beta-lactamase class A